MICPALIISGQDGAAIIIGDCHDVGCAPQILDTAGRLLVQRGFVVAINTPYAGRFTIG